MRCRRVTMGPTRSGSLRRATEAVAAPTATATSSSREIRHLRRLLRPVSTGHQLVRLGGTADGGYLVPDDLAGIGAAYSPGVGESTSFDRHLNALGVPCFLMDGTVEPPSGFEERFLKEMLVAHPGPAGMTLEAWVASTMPSGGEDLMLQMDIEGDEWNILATVPRELLRRFRIIVVELHGLHRSVRRETATAYRRTLECLNRDHVVAHIHPNNCCGLRRVGGIKVPKVLEVTLLRRDRVIALGSHGGRHALDRPNLPGRPDVALPKAWFRPPLRTRP